MKRSLLAVTLCMFAASVCAQNLGPSAGTICGNVRDETGQPASLVRVAAIYSGGMAGMRPLAVTDRQGRYCITDLMFGEYTMSADDPKKGYPDMQALFYAPHTPGHPVTVTYKSPNGHSDFQIPYKAASLHVQLTDARSGKTIKSMSYHLALRAHPTYTDYGTSGSTQTLLFPPNTEVMLWLTAPGYSKWPDDGSSAHQFNLQPGENAVLEIALRPVP